MTGRSGDSDPEKVLKDFCYLWLTKQRYKTRNEPMFKHFFGVFGDSKLNHWVSGNTIKVRKDVLSFALFGKTVITFIRFFHSHSF